MKICDDSAMNNWRMKLYAIEWKAAKFLAYSELLIIHSNGGVKYSGVGNWKQQTIENPGNRQYQYCSQPCKSLNYYLLVMLLVTNHCKVSLRHTAENKCNGQHTMGRYSQYLTGSESPTVIPQCG
jgi:hypothetical protein